MATHVRHRKAYRVTLQLDVNNHQVFRLTFCELQRALKPPPLCQHNLQLLAKHISSLCVVVHVRVGARDSMAALSIQRLPPTKAEQDQPQKQQCHLSYRRDASLLELLHIYNPPSLRHRSPSNTGREGVQTLFWRSVNNVTLPARTRPSRAASGPTPAPPAGARRAPRGGPGRRS